MERKLGDFPQFWWFSAGIYSLIAIGLIITGYRRYRGMGGITFLERMVLWTNKLIKGEKNKESERKLLADTKKNKLYGLSAFLVAVVFFVAAIISIIVGIILLNTK